MLKTDSGEGKQRNSEELAVTRATRMLRQFEALTGHKAEGVWRAPGRVNLIGEHTDYNQGFVLPIAIDRAVYVAAARRGDRRIRGLSLQERKAFELDIDSLSPGKVAGWAGYPCGAAWALGCEGIEVQGCDLVIDSTVPPGAGLASSAALTTATALCLSDLAGSTLSATELARTSHRAEVEFVGVPCGVMDQMISALGRPRQALFLDTESSAFDFVPFAPAGEDLALAVMDTRVSHRLWEGEYGRRRKECEEAAALLGVKSLREVSLSELPAALEKLPHTLQKRVRHVVTENDRVVEAVEALRGRDFTQAGSAFIRSHESLRTEFEVSCPELDAAVAAALDAGALGARMTGAGFGGSAIALIEATRVPAFSQEVQGAFERLGLAAPAIFQVTPSGGAGRL